MIDLHSHIIPKIDDGSKSIEDSIAMIKEAKNAGFTDIFLTPHYIENYFDLDVQSRKEKFAELREIVKENNIEINLFLGSEIFINPEIDKLYLSNTILTLNNSKYMLIEIPMNDTILYLDDVIENLVSIGITPILAHPERYQCVQNDINVCEGLIDKGALFQMNFGSIIGVYGKDVKKTAIKLLKNNYIHFLGSDAHRKESLYTKIESAKKKIIKIIGKEKIDILTIENPKHIMNNITMEI